MYYSLNSHTSAEVKGQPIGLVTAILYGESQMSKEVTQIPFFDKIVQKDAFPGYPCCCCCSSDSDRAIQSCNQQLLNIICVL